MTKENSLWRFLASVKLALTTLLVLAVASILGTVIKQGQAPEYYLQEYGPGLARFLEAADLTSMYTSWWFVALLALFAVNLVVCSIDRLPGVWRLMTLDNLDVDPRRLEKMSCTHRADTNTMPGTAAERILQLLSRSGWKNPRSRERDGAILLFAQKGAWTRFGVYVVHLSILIILAGAMLGILFGYQAYVYLPEGRAASHIFLRQSKEPVPLGFELRSDRFEKSFYANGAVREYRADLTVFDPELDEPYRKSIIVNDPLSYRGLTFYLGDSYPMEEYFIVLRNGATGAEQAFRLPAGREAAWQESGVSLRIEELKHDEEGAVNRARISFMAEGAGRPSVFWLEDQGSAAIGLPGRDFTLSFRQLHSTLLLVKKDPGVSTLFFGSGLMVVGLVISFFLSHRRIWIRISPEGKKGSRILFAGTANKNNPAFEEQFRKLISGYAQDGPGRVEKSRKIASPESAIAN